MKLPQEVIDVLCKARSSLRDLCHGYDPEDCCEHPESTAGTITRMLGDGYDCAPMKTKIVIVIEGGVVQAVLSNQPDVVVKILNHDAGAEANANYDPGDAFNEAAGDCLHDVY